MKNAGWKADADAEMNREQAARKISTATTRMVAGINQAVLSGIHTVQPSVQLRTASI